MKQYIMHVLGAVSQELYFPDAHLTDIIEILILTYLIYHKFTDGHGYSGNCSISAGTSKGSGKAWGEAVPEFDRTI